MAARRAPAKKKSRPKKSTPRSATLHGHVDGVAASRLKLSAEFGAVVVALAEEPGVDASESRGFGSGALKVDGKIFAMIISRGRFVIKLPASRVQALIRDGQGQPMQMRERVMKEWLIVDAPASAWPALAREALEFVRPR